MANHTLAELVAEQNRLAMNSAPQRPYAVVRVLVANRYNGPDLKAKRANVGDVITVAGGRYADDLIASGLVEIPVIVSDGPEEEDSDLSALSMAELRTLAKTMGINSFGMSKATLLEALANAEAEEPEEEADGD